MFLWSQAWAIIEFVAMQRPIGGFPKIRGTILRVPIRRTIVFWGLYWGPPILGNYHRSNLHSKHYAAKPKPLT